MNLQTYSSSTQVILREEIAFLLRRLQTREDDDRIAAAEAILSADDVEAEACFLRIREISNIRKVVVASFAPATLPTLAHNPESNSLPSLPQTISLSSRGLAVSIGGQRISGYTDASVFASVIHEIGCEKVAKLNLTLNYLPLVSKELHKLSHQHYTMQIERRGDWYIVTHASTERKRELLKRICRRLGLGLTVEK